MPSSRYKMLYLLGLIIPDSNSQSAVWRLTRNEQEHAVHDKTVNFAAWHDSCTEPRGFALVFM